MRGYEEDTTLVVAGSEEQELQPGNGREGELEVCRILNNRIGQKDYPHGLMDAATKPKSRTRTGDSDCRDLF